MCLHFQCSLSVTPTIFLDNFNETLLSVFTGTGVFQGSYGGAIAYLLILCLSTMTNGKREMYVDNSFRCLQHCDKVFFMSNLFV